MTEHDDTPLGADATLGMLLAAAKRETPRAEAREHALERALAAAHQPAPSRRNRSLAATGVLLALAAAVALWTSVESARDAPANVTAERVPPLAQTNPTPDLPKPRAGASATSEDVPATGAPPAQVEKPQAPRPAPTLADEIAQLEAARAALGAGDPKRALALLDHYTHATRGARLGDEALVLRLDALTRAGRGAEAAALARDFVAKNPGSPLVDRARAFTADPNAARAAAGGGTTP